METSSGPVSDAPPLPGTRSSPPTGSVLRRRGAVGRRSIPGPAQGADLRRSVRPGPADTALARRRRRAPTPSQPLPQGTASLRGVRKASVAHVGQGYVPVLLLPRAVWERPDRVPSAIHPCRRRRDARRGPVPARAAAAIVGASTDRGTGGRDRRGARPRPQSGASSWRRRSPGSPRSEASSCRPSTRTRSRSTS
jgi:hypothetical protein